MPPIRDHDMSFEDDEDDDGMPPLVENPNPSMTFTFFTDMTPITFSSTNPTSLEILPETPNVPSPPESPLLAGEVPTTSPSIGRVSHGKKRDASYIPRPPNAFILFRSSFIKSQQVPGKVEGNHSTLSKIIGMYWKTLPREEREQWEAKAVIAQAEHRKRYPDWRFRPGANAIAKLKVKDGTTKKRHTHVRKAKEEGEDHDKSMEKRCAKIADLLVEGKKGPALEAAVKEWEGHTVKTADSEEGTHQRLTNCLEADGGKQDKPNRKLTRSRGQRSEAGRDDVVVTGKRVVDAIEEYISQSPKLLIDAIENIKGRSKTPDALSDCRFKVPLTSMFRRSLSEPASHNRCPFPDIPSTASGVSTHVRRDTVSIPITDIPLLPQLHGLFAPQKQHEAATRRDDNHDTLNCLTSSRSLSCPESCSTRCNDPFAHHFLDAPVPFVSFSPTPTMDHNAADTSPPTSLEEIYTVNVPSNITSLGGGDSQGKQNESGTDLGMTYSVYKYQPQLYSSYSTLKNWDRQETSRAVAWGARGLPFPPEPLSSSFSYYDGVNMRDNWEEGAADAVLAAHVPNIDTAFGWYPTQAENHRGSSAVIDHYPGRLNVPGVKASSTTANESGDSADNFVFFSTDAI